MGAQEPMTEATLPPSTAVVEAVAAEEGWEDPTTAPEPLYEAIDPDALDALVESLDRGRITFNYRGYDVTLAGDGRVTLGGS